MPTSAVRRTVAVCLLLLLAGPLRAQGSVRVLEVLQKHCFECHGPRGRVSDVFSLADAVALARVAPSGRPGGSELLDLVNGGIMPPTRQPRLSSAEQTALRDWVQAGAPNLLGSDYVWTAIADDAARAGPGDLPYYRYFTLHHRLAAGDSASQIETQRKALNALLGHLAGKSGEMVKSLGPPDTVLRIDLRQLGWTEPAIATAQRKPVEGGKTSFVEARDVPFNWFDLVLLEYPYALIPSNRESFTATAKQFLLKSKQVRPVAAVAADWFLARASSGWLHDALLRGSGTGPLLPDQLGESFKAPLDLATVLAELGGLTSAAELRREAARVSQGSISLAPLAEGKTVPRDDWERLFPSLVRQLNLGIPVAPYDSLGQEDQPRGPELANLAFLKVSDGQPATTFKVGDQFMPRVENKGTTPLYVEVFISQANGNRPMISQAITKIEAGQAWTFKFADNTSLAFDPDDVPAMLMIVFASKEPMPALLRAATAKDARTPLPARYFHRLHELDASGRGIKPESDPANVSRQVLRITVEKK